MLIESLESRWLMSVVPSLSEPFAVESLIATKVAVAAPTNLVVQFSSSTLPASVVAGAKANANVLLVIQNRDTTSVAGKLIVSLYAVPTGGSIDSSTVALATGKLTNYSFHASSYKPVKFHITSIPAGLTNGDYTLQAQVTDPTGTVITSSPDGGAFTVADPFLALATRQLSGNIPSSVKSGETVPVTLKLLLGNNGNIATTKPTTLDVLASTDGLPADATVVATHAQFYKITPGKIVPASVKVKEFDLADGTYQVFIRATDQLGNVTYSQSDLSVTVAPATYALTTTWKPQLSLGNYGGPGPLLLETKGNAILTNTGHDPIVGTITINVYITLNDSYGTTDPQEIPPPPASLPIATFTASANLKPHQKMSVPIQTSVPYNGSSDGAYYQYTLGIVDPQSNVSYYVDPQPAAV